MCTPSALADAAPPNALCRQPRQGWRIAFASAEGEQVDQHFGSTPAFYFYEIGATQNLSLGSITLPRQREAGHDGRLRPLLESLRGCRMVYCADIGPGAVQRLLGAGIQPMRVAKATPILALLDEIRTTLARPVECRGHAQPRPNPDGCERFLEILEHESWQP